jgi:hypothetical protein
MYRDKTKEECVSGWITKMVCMLLLITPKSGKRPSPLGRGRAN